jgi:RNA-directed DNA polymerase
LGQLAVLRKFKWQTNSTVLDSLAGTSVDREKNLKFLQDLLKEKIDPYADFKVRKNRFGKLRAISTPFPQLRFFQLQILSDLRQLDTHECAHSYTRDRSVATAAKPHLGMKWGVRMDLEDFFHHINDRQIRTALIGKVNPRSAEIYSKLVTRSSSQVKSRVPEKFKTRGSRSQAAKWRLWLLEVRKLRNKPVALRRGLVPTAFEVTSKILSMKPNERRYVPQGAPTSGLISNIAFEAADIEIQAFARISGLTYTRYSDDILLSSKNGRFSRGVAGEIIQRTQQIVQAHGHTLNRAKTRIITPGSRKSFLGMLVDGSELRLPIEIRRNISAELRDIKKFGFETQALRFKHGLSRIRRNASKGINTENGYWNVLRGFLCWVQAADLKLFSELEAIYRPTFADGTVAIELEDDPDAKLLAELFERKKPKSLEPSPINLQSGLEIVDIDLKF